MRGILLFFFFCQLILNGDNEWFNVESNHLSVSCNERLSIELSHNEQLWFTDYLEMGKNWTKKKTKDSEKWMNVMRKISVHSFMHSMVFIHIIHVLPIISMQLDTASDNCLFFYMKTKNLYVLNQIFIVVEEKQKRK